MLRKATEGLLEGELPYSKLNDSGDLGFGAIPFQQKQLELRSGLKMGFEHADTQGTATIIVTVQAGHADDPKGRSSMAHLIEHLVFASRVEAFDGQSLVSWLQRNGLGVGAGFNASTSMDEASFTLHVPVEKVPDALVVVEHILRSPLAGVTETDLLSAKRTIANELWESDSFKTSKVIRLLFRSVYPVGHKYSQRIDEEGDLEKITLKEAKAFARNFYKPSRATAYVLTPDEDVRGLLKRHLPISLHAQAKPAQSILEPKSTSNAPLPAVPKNGVYQIRTTSTKPVAWVTWRLPALNGKYGHLTRLLTASQMLSTMEGLLYWIHRDIDDISLAHIQSAESTLLTAQIVLSSTDDLGEVLKRVVAQLSQMWTPIDIEQSSVQNWRAAAIAEAWNNELFMMRQSMTASVVFGAGDPRHRAKETAAGFHATGKISSFAHQINRVSSTSMDEVAALGRKLLAPEYARIQVGIPIEKTGTQKRAPAKAVTQKQVEPLATSFGEGSALVPLQIGSEKIYTGSAAGMKVLVVPRRAYPVLTVALAFHGGAAAAPVPGTVELLRYHERATAIDERMAGLDVVGSDYPDLSAEIVNAGKMNLHNALHLLARKIKETDRTPWRDFLDFDLPDYYSVRSTVRRTAISDSEAAMRTRLFGEHPYGRRVTEKDILAVDARAMHEHLIRMRTPRNAVLVIVGDVDPTEALSAANGWYRNWNAPQNFFRLKLPKASPVEGGGYREKLFKSDTERSATTLVASCRLPNELENPAAYAVFERVVNSWLFREIRERQGLTYTPFSGLRSFDGGAAVFTSVLELPPGHERQALSVLRAGFSGALESVINSDSVSVALRSVASRRRARLQSTLGTVNVILDAVRNDWPLDDTWADLKALEQVGVADVWRVLDVCRHNMAYLVRGRSEQLQQIN